ncbi:hypothetical protein MES5069_680011 [Mesorhizobium escarrei]|uniref:Uncharacterized protein n=1 Tax=Mesorhizobium escarrei TaxID=666018 RepID=A0ABM9EG23_9HYPH|nr:hypothetical protein MES5069_680011 [Mesorhizobium escarrei]
MLCAKPNDQPQGRPFPEPDAHNLHTAALDRSPDIRTVAVYRKKMPAAATETKPFDKPAPIRAKCLLKIQW